MGTSFGTDWAGWRARRRCTLIQKKLNSISVQRRACASGMRISRLVRPRDSTRSLVGLTQAFHAGLRAWRWPLCVSPCLDERNQRAAHTEQHKIEFHTRPLREGNRMNWLMTFHAGEVECGRVPHSATIRGERGCERPLCRGVVVIQEWARRWELWSPLQA